MRASVDFRKSLSPADQADLDEFAAWPLEMVEDGGNPCGIVMPLIPPEFFLTTHPVGAPPERLVFDLSWLCAKEAQARVKGVDRSGVQDPLVRLALLAQLVYAVGRLHKHGAVYGDLSLKNAALALNPPRVKLLDCDAAAGLSDLNRRQVHSPFFKPPEIRDGSQRLQDDRTDVYKLGLCVIRGMQHGPGVSQACDPNALRGLLDGETIRVLRRSVGTDRLLRPTAKELFGCLERVILARASPPVLHSASLNRRVLVRGQDVRVTWDATAGTQVRITGVNGLDIELTDPERFGGGYVVTPRGSGEIWVEVANRHGTVRLPAGSVELYELPPFSLVDMRLPRPSLQGLPPLAIPEVLSALPAVPAVTTYEHAVPGVEAPSLDRLLDSLRPLRTVSSPFDRIDEAVVAGGRRVRDVVDAAGGVGVRDLTLLPDRATEEARQIVEQGLQALRDRLEQHTSAATPSAGSGTGTGSGTP